MCNCRPSLPSPVAVAAPRPAPIAVRAPQLRGPFAQAAAFARALAGPTMEPTGLRGTVRTCTRYKCKVDGDTMVCSRRCTTITAGRSSASWRETLAVVGGVLADLDDGADNQPSAGPGCKWVCNQVNDELVVCDRQCDRPRVPPPAQYPPGHPAA